jgi:hypothetical protein
MTSTISNVADKQALLLGLTDCYAIALWIDPIINLKTVSCCPVSRWFGLAESTITLKCLLIVDSTAPHRTAPSNVAGR